MAGPDVSETQGRQSFWMLDIQQASATGGNSQQRLAYHQIWLRQKRRLLLGPVKMSVTGNLPPDVLKLLDTTLAGHDVTLTPTSWQE